jgi:hypothetical protein
VFTEPTITGTTASSSSLSASLADWQSSRSRRYAARSSGVAAAAACPAGGGLHVLEHGLVEVDATEALDALRLAGLHEASLGAAQHGRVEGAAAQVVDADHVPDVHPLAGGVVDRSRVGLADEHRRWEARLRHLASQQLAPVGAPVRRVRDDHAIGQATLAGADVVHDVGEERRGELLGGQRGITEHERRRVTEPSLELSGQADRVFVTSPASSIAENERTVGPDEDHRGHRRRVVAERHDVDAIAPHDGRGRTRRPQIDAQHIPHQGAS